MSSTPKDVLREIDRAEPVIRDAFLAWVAEIVSDAKLAELERLIERKASVAQIVEALGITRESLAGLVEAVRSTYSAGAALETGVRGRGLARVRLRFDIGNPIARRWVEENGARLVTDIIESQQGAISSVVSAAVDAGRGPRSVALDIIGRQSAQGRVGGIVGLTEQQAQYVVNARRELLELDSNYFTRARRDKRFDSIVRRAIRDGKPLSAGDIDRVAGRYSDRLLAYRGEVIGRTEALEALNAGRDATYQQAIADGTLRADLVTKQWKSASDKRVRDSHRNLHNQIVPFDGVFLTINGSRMKHPGDTSMSAVAADVIQCRCVANYVVDFLAQELGGG